MIKSKNKFAKWFIFLTTPLMYILHPVKFVGKENIPEGGGYILAANHISILDPFYVALGSQKELFFMAKSDLFKKKRMAKFLTKMNAFPVKRDSYDLASIKKAISVVDDGGILGIFPEGKVNLNVGAPQESKQGIALIADKCKCGVLPVSLYNKTGRRLFTRLTVRFGEFIPYETLFSPERGRKENYQFASDLIIEKITEMWENGHA
ncbi:MAG: 1-acyl-sn-glycerol-3-phosphate acyltransferase [Clostridia bacterium]|nr:1-acyl-sn-glycerol-3-phosphate acyltransferase [Clostridia bacterium]